jgi:hypothetical protein
MEPIELEDVKEKIERPIEKLIFKAEFTAGYVVRQVLEFYEKLIIHGIPFYFKEKDISIVTGTGGSKNSRRLISTMDIYTDDIIDYYLDPDLVNIQGDEETESCYVEQFNIELVKTFLKTISKTCSIMFHKTTASDIVHVTIKGNATIRSGIKSGKYQTVEYDLSGFEDFSEKPNVRIDTGEFCTSIKGMTKDSGHTSFRVLKNGLFLENYSSNGATTKKGGFGKIPQTDIDDQQYFETKVSGSTIKALQKISGMSTNSIVKITSEEDGYLQIRHKIGDFGEHRIYLVDTAK